MKFLIRLIEEKDNHVLEMMIHNAISQFDDEIKNNSLNKISDVYSEPKTAYYVAEDDEGNIVAGLGVYKIEGNENTCELKDLVIKDSFIDSNCIDDLIIMCIAFSKKYYNSICIKINDDYKLIENILIEKKFKQYEEPICGIEILENQKFYLLKFKTVGWASEVFGELFGQIIAAILMFLSGCLMYIILPKDCRDNIDLEWLMVLGTLLVISVPLLIGCIIGLIFKRKDKKK